jgi:tyrosine-protein kinase Etk/Wzc
VTTGLEREPASARQTGEHDISFFELLTPLIRRWRLIVGTAVATAVLAAILLLLQKPTYVAKTTFTPEASSSSGPAGSLAALAGVASQLGLSTGSSSSVSSDFFVKLASSGEVLRSTLLTEFADAEVQDKKRPLIEILKVPGDSLEERLQRGVVVLRGRVKVAADKPTGIVTLEVHMGSSQLAAAVANRLVELLNEFNLERRQSQSREQRRFTGERLAEAERDLRDSERAELAFLQKNRDYSSSPLLTFESGRLARDVQVKQELFLTLSKAHTEARIAEVRDTPVLTVVDSAVAPFRRASPRRTLGVLVAAVAGTILGVALAYVANARDRARAHPRPDYLEFREAWDAARRGARSG